MALILETDTKPSVSATSRSAIPEHDHHLMSLTCLPNLAQGMHLPSGFGGNSVMWARLQGSLGMFGFLAFGLSSGASVKNPLCNVKTWLKDPLEWREWLPTQRSCLENLKGQRSLAIQPAGSQAVGHDWVTNSAITTSLWRMEGCVRTWSGCRVSLCVVPGSACYMTEC